MKHPTMTRLLCAILTLCLLCGGLAACSQGDEVPEGYQNATCNGEYFRLYIPTQWTSSTESGVSGGYHSLAEGTAVSMMEVDFDLPSAEPSTGEGETTPADVTATLDDFVKAHVAQVSTFKGYKVLKDLTDTNMGGRIAAKEISYLADRDGVTYGYRQIMVKAEGRFYLFTYSGVYDEAAFEEEGTNTFTRWKDTVDGILQNITFYKYPYEGGENDRKIPNVKEIPEGMKLVTGNDVAYRFFAPESWIMGKADAADLVYASETDRSNVSVMGYVPDAESYSVADYWEDTEKHYQETLKDYTLIGEPVESTMGGKDATVYEYTYSLGGVTYRCRQTVCVYSYMIVVMTYTALPENYDAHLAEVEAMQGALTFRTPVIG